MLSRLVRAALILGCLVTSAYAVPIAFTFSDGLDASGTLVIDTAHISTSVPNASVASSNWTDFDFSYAGHTWDLGDVVPGSYVNLNGTLSPYVVTGFSGLIATNADGFKLHLAGSAGFDGSGALQLRVLQYQGPGVDPTPLIVGAYDGITAQTWGHWSGGAPVTTVPDGGATIALLGASCLAILAFVRGKRIA